MEEFLILAIGNYSWEYTARANITYRWLFGKRHYACKEIAGRGSFDKCPHALQKALKLGIFTVGVTYS